MKTIPFLTLFILLTGTSSGQLLKPYFDKKEYIETLKINQKTHIALNKWADNRTLPDPDQYRFVYRSPVVAFDNLWDLWTHHDKKIALISVQGSIPTEASFLANLYAAMVPAKGRLVLNHNKNFDYNLADHPNAAVHVGWLIAMAHMSESIVSKIDSCYSSGIKDFILTGHSQGGGITFLLTSHLERLKKDKIIPSDIQFKTYCSAGPKPGNLFYAYDYEHQTAGGWACNVVNTADWVPDVPFTVQTVNDFTSVNPFKNAKKMIRKQKFPKNMALKYAYNRLNKPSMKAQRNYQKFLGKMMSKAVYKQIPDLKTPAFYNSNYYVRTGTTIVLYADKDYYEVNKEDPANPAIWQHHFPLQYLYLAERYHP